MPRIDLTKEAVAAGVGVVDELVGGIVLTTPIDVMGLGLQDLVRLGGAGATILAWMNNVSPALVEPAMYGFTTLAAKSATRLMQNMLAPVPAAALGTPRAAALGTPRAAAIVRQQAMREAAMAATAREPEEVTVF